MKSFKNAGKKGLHYLHKSSTLLKIVLVAQNTVSGNFHLEKKIKSFKNAGKKGLHYLHKSSTLLKIVLVSQNTVSGNFHLEKKIGKKFGKKDKKF